MGCNPLGNAVAFWNPGMVTARERVPVSPLGAMHRNPIGRPWQVIRGTKGGPNLLVEAKSSRQQYRTGENSAGATRPEVADPERSHQKRRPEFLRCQMPAPLFRR